MGQGSRGGNSGVSSSGVRQRVDKEEQRARRNPTVVDNNRNNGSNSRSSSSSSSSSSSQSKSSNRRNLRMPRGLRLPRLPHTTGSKGSKSGGGGSGKFKTPPPPKQVQTPIKRITRIKPVKIRLTKQRTNKTPN